MWVRLLLQRLADTNRLESDPPCPLAAVYEYWLKKRQRLNKPILRRLQVPPAVSDQNYNNVFRPREKVHRRVVSPRPPLLVCGA